MRVLRSLVPLIASTICLLSPSVYAHASSRDKVNYISVVDNPVIRTPSHRVHALSQFDVTFELHKGGQHIKLSLEPNHSVLAHDAQIAFLSNDGSIQRTEPIRRQDHRVFKGTAWVQLQGGAWERVGWARITVKQDGAHPLLEGAFSIMHDHHHLMLRSRYMQTRHASDPDLPESSEETMVVVRDSDYDSMADQDLKRSLTRSACGMENLKFNTDPNHPVFRPPFQKEDTSSWNSVSLDYLFGLTKRQDDNRGGGRAPPVNLRSTIGRTAGCPNTRKVALVGVATDCEYTRLIGSKELATSRVIELVNGASGVFEDSFNITLGLRNLTVYEEDCPGNPTALAPWNVACGPDGNPTITTEQRLNLFSAWRGNQGDNNAFWTLMTACSSGLEVGLAWLGQLCVNGIANGDFDVNDPQTQAVSGASVVVSTSNEWQVFAHEAAHIFGGVHDCNTELCARGFDMSSQCCPVSGDSCDANSRFIMNPSSGRGMRQFSPCTVGNICSAMGRSSVDTTCLSDNRDVITISGSQCGNGIVEEGEDCDCGGEAGCGGNSCCNPTTCKFAQGAVCDDSNEECCSGCQFARQDVVCRLGNGPCDPEERCSGTSSGCPQDRHAEDGAQCGNGLRCASGQCTSRDEQCRSLMGARLGSNDTYACNGASCTLLCASDVLPENSCSQMMQNFLDGTPCSGGGMCQNGRCTGASFTDEIGSWIDDNRPIVIGVSVGVGSLILLSVIGCIVRRCRRPRNRKMAPLPYSPPMAHGQWPAQRGIQPFPPSPANAPAPPYPGYALGMGMPQRVNPPAFRYG